MGPLIMVSYLPCSEVWALLGFYGVYKGASFFQGPYSGTMKLPKIVGFPSSALVFPIHPESHEAPNPSRPSTRS